MVEARRRRSYMPAVATYSPLIDTDTHVSEPADLWTSRIASKWGEDIPQLVFDDRVGGRRWRVGKSLLFHEAKLAMAGGGEYPPLHPPSLEVADAGSWDPNVRIKRMDEYGIYAQVLYPNLIAFCTEAFMALPDPRLRLECVSAYNDFLVDFASPDPRRLVPIMMLPFWDMEAAEKEVVRAAGLGHKGVLLASHFQLINLPPLWDPHWDRLLHLIEDLGLSINFHIGFGQFTAEERDERAHAPTGDEHARLTAAGMLGNSRAIADVICTGICHRFPKLKFVSVESGAGWLLYFMESLDWHWKAYGGTRDRPERELPSYYFRRQIYGSFWFEQESVRLIAENMADNIMFESDFPHPTSLSPGPASPAARPRDMAEAAVKGLPDDVIAKIFYKNAAKLYHLDLSAAMPASRP